MRNVSLPMFGLSLIMIGTALLWLLHPASYPFGAADRVTVSVTHLLEHDLASTLLFILGGLGVAAALLLRSARSLVQRAARAATLIIGILLLLIFCDTTLLTTTGYLLALASAPGVVAVLIVAAVRRSRAGIMALITFAILVAAGIVSGFLRPATILTYLGNLSAAFASYAVRLAWGMGAALVTAAVLLLGTASLVPGVLRRLERRGSADARRLRRTGLVATVIAALCLVPYAFERLTWLTPWPLGMSGENFPLAIRLQGVMIGLGAIGGIVLTAGLVRRWGEVFPRWLPRVGGRRVPIRLAVIPGLTVAFAAAMTAPGMIVSLLQMDAADALRGLALMPLPIWAPALTIAVIAYGLRRHAALRQAQTLRQAQGTF